MTTPLTASSSRAEELAMLDKWRKEAGDQSYLASFLSSGAIEWLQMTIRDDGNCDLHSWYKAELEGNQRLSKDISMMGSQLDECHKNHERYVADAEQGTKTMSEQRVSEVDALNRRIGNLGEIVRQEREHLVEEKLKTMAAQSQIADLEQTVLELKARVLDLQDEQEARRSRPA